MTLSNEIKTKLIMRIQEEIADHDFYEMFANEFENPCKQVLEDIAKEEKNHAWHLHNILYKHNVEIPNDLEDKLKNM